MTMMRIWVMASCLAHGGTTEQVARPDAVSRVQSLVSTEFEKQFQKKAPAGAKSGAAARCAAAESGGATAKRKRGGR